MCKFVTSFVPCFQISTVDPGIWEMYREGKEGLCVPSRPHEPRNARSRVVSFCRLCDFVVVLDCFSVLQLLGEMGSTKMVMVLNRR